MNVRSNRSPQPFIILRKDFIADRRLSYEAVGYYAMLETEQIDVNEIPLPILRTLVEVGILEEVAE